MLVTVAFFKVGSAAQIAGPHIRHVRIVMGPIGCVRPHASRTAWKIVNCVKHVENVHQSKPMWFYTIWSSCCNKSSRRCVAFCWGHNLIEKAPRIPSGWSLQASNLRSDLGQLYHQQPGTFFCGFRTYNNVAFCTSINESLASIDWYCDTPNASLATLLVRAWDQVHFVSSSTCYNTNCRSLPLFWQLFGGRFDTGLVDPHCRTVGSGGLLHLLCNNLHRLFHLLSSLSVQWGHVWTAISCRLVLSLPFVNVVSTGPGFPWYLGVQRKFSKLDMFTRSTLVCALARHVKLPLYSSHKSLSYFPLIRTNPRIQPWMTDFASHTWKILSGFVVSTYRETWVSSTTHFLSRLHRPGPLFDTR